MKDESRFMLQSTTISVHLDNNFYEPTTDLYARRIPMGISIAQVLENLARHYIFNVIGDSTVDAPMAFGAWFGISMLAFT